MSIEKKFASLGFAYNAKGNIYGRQVINPSPIPEECFFKTHPEGVEMYAKNPLDETMWDHVILNLESKEVTLDETVPESTILNL